MGDGIEDMGGGSMSPEILAAFTGFAKEEAAERLRVATQQAECSRVDDGIAETDKEDDKKTGLRKLIGRFSLLSGRRKDRNIGSTDGWDDSTAIRIGNFVGVDDLPADGWPNEFKPDAVKQILDALPADE